MTGWYYERNGERAGPVTADDIRDLCAQGVLNAATLVWQADFGANWRVLGDTEFAAAAQQGSGPPPLPSAAVPPGSQTGDVPRDFLDSDLTKALIGPRHDYYLKKWTPILERAGYNSALLTKQRSWNWPAFFVPYAWTFYRKLFALGAIILGLQVLSAFADVVAPAISKATGFAAMAVSIVAAIYGNAWYLDSTFKKWKRLQSVADPAQRGMAVARDGGASRRYAAAAVVAVFLIVLSPLLFDGDLLGSDVSCSSQNARDTVASIAREQLDKNGYGALFVDSAATTVKLDAIRTQGPDGAGVKCAATISYGVVLKNQERAQSEKQESAILKSSAEQALNKDITYKVEKTDDGKNIYVTVFGLN